MQLQVRPVMYWSGPLGPWLVRSEWAKSTRTSTSTSSTLSSRALSADTSSCIHQPCHAMPCSVLLCSWAVRAPMNGFSRRPSGRLPVLCCTPVCRGVMNLHPQIERGRPFRASCRSATPSRTRSGANKIRRPGCCPPNSSYQKHFIPDVNPTRLENSTRQTRMQEMI